MPYMLCLRFGGRYIHPDYLLNDLTVGQLEDWLQVDRQVNLAINRDDILFALARQDTHGANKEEGKMSARWQELNPYQPESELPDRGELEARLGLDDWAEAVEG